MSTFILILGLLLLILFSYPVLLNVINFANILGMVLSVALCLYGKYFHSVNARIKSMWEKKTGKIALSFLSVICIGILITAGIITGFMITAANNTSQKDTTVVVLGCQVYPDGPSITLQTRIDAAYDYLSKNTDAACILSGGQGNDEHISEAQAMYNELVTMGIDKNRLFIEDKSTSTRENLLFSKKIIEKNGLNTDITVVTNEFHQYRARKIAKELRINSYSYSAATPFYLFPTYYVRELFAIVYEHLR